MRRLKTSIVPVASAVLACCASISPAAATDITSLPYVITVPGYYRVTSDLSLTGDGPAIEIRSGGVRLNLNGRTLAVRDTAVAIYAHDLTGLTIEAGSIHAYGFGVYARNVQSALVQGLAIQVVGPNSATYGMVSDHCRALTIQNCSYRSSTSRDTAFQMFYGSGNTLRGCRADGRGRGLFVQGETSLTVSGNTCVGLDLPFDLSDVESSVISDNRADGIGYGFTFLHARNCRIIGNVAQGSQVGIQMLACTGNWLETNTTRLCRLSGMILNDNATGNTVLNNLTTGNTLDGIFVGLSCSGNTIMANRASANQRYDLEDGNPACDSNRWSGNVFTTRNQTCIH